MVRRGEGLFSKHVTPRGYVRGVVWQDGKRRGMMEHRWVMEQALGRRLEAHEVVHHINGVRTDNRLENLALYSDGHGAHVAHEHVPRQQAEAAVRRDQVIAMRRQGMSQTAIAQTLGIGQASVSRYLAHAGLRARADRHASTSG